MDKLSCIGPLCQVSIHMRRTIIVGMVQVGLFVPQQVGFVNIIWYNFKKTTTTYGKYTIIIKSIHAVPSATTSGVGSENANRARQQIAGPISYLQKASFTDCCFRLCTYRNPREKVFQDIQPTFFPLHCRPAPLRLPHPHVTFP